jgi:hypothetical protein
MLLTLPVDFKIYKKNISLLYKSYKWINGWKDGYSLAMTLYLDVGWPIWSLYSHDNSSKTAKQFLTTQRYQSTIAIVGLEQDAAYTASNPSIKAAIYQTLCCVIKCGNKSLSK